MPRVAPFAGLHYSLGRFGRTTVPDRVRLADDADAPPTRLADLTDVVCPPYDVIDDEQRAASCWRVTSATRCGSSSAPTPIPMPQRPRALDAWPRTGPWSAASSRRSTTTATRPRRSRRADRRGDRRRACCSSRGGAASARTSTRCPGPKADRLALLRATRTQLSPILAVYFDRSERYQHVMSRAWTDEWRARDGDGLLHQLAAIEPDERLIGYLARQTLFVADGHHRYETALAYQAEVRADPRWTDAAPGELAADWIMMLLVNAELERARDPAHPSAPAATSTPMRCAALVAGDDPLWQAIPIAPGALGGRRSTSAAPMTRRPSASLLPGDDGYLLVGDPDGLDGSAAARADGPRGRAPSTSRRSTSRVLGDRLGIGPDDVAAGDAPRLH